MPVIESKLSNLDEHIQSSFDAIQLLYGKAHYQHARYCAFILIDQLAWLVSDPKANVSTNFKTWVDKYFIPYYPELTAEEILASRNGLLHRSSSISQSIERGFVDRQLWFIDNLKHAVDIKQDMATEKPGFYVVNSVKFIQLALHGAVCDFRRDLTISTDLSLDEFDRKLGELLQPVTL